MRSRLTLAVSESFESEDMEATDEDKAGNLGLEMDKDFFGNLWLEEKGSFPLSFGAGGCLDEDRVEGS
ncbi:hypothetical protein ACOSP7_002909 [Xanthoceras sorbifolium]